MAAQISSCSFAGGSAGGRCPSPLPLRGSEGRKPRFFRPLLEGKKLVFASILRAGNGNLHHTRPGSLPLRTFEVHVDGVAGVPSTVFGATLSAAVVLSFAAAPVPTPEPDPPPDLPTSGCRNVRWCGRFSCRPP